MRFRAGQPRDIRRAYEEAMRLRDTGRRALIICRGGLFLRLRAIALALRGPPTMLNARSWAVIDRPSCDYMTPV